MSIARYFGDGSPHDRSAVLDSRTGRLGGWTKADFTYSVNVHQRAFGARYTTEVLFKMYGVEDVSKTPPYMYGSIIGALAAEMSAGLPHSIAKGPMYRVKEHD